MAEEKQFTHISADGLPTMVDVSEKKITRRTAVAKSQVHLPKIVLDKIQEGDIVTKKGSVFQTAIIAGVSGAKQTAQLIPFCHPIPLENCKISIALEKNVVTIQCETVTTGKTGIEMEALTGASVAALTIYDMCKALSQDIVIGPTQLVAKTGGKQNIDKRT